MVIFKYLFIVCLTFASAITTAGSYVSRPVQDIVDAKIPTKGDGSLMSLDEVKFAILSACDRRGWSTELLDQNSIRATLVVREHFSAINIVFSPTKYSLTYQESRKMDFRSQDRSINAKFNIWLEMLSKDIQTQLFLSLLPK